MVYLSLNFLVFVLISLTGYYLLPKNNRWLILLLSSVIFYLSYDKRYFIVLLLSTLITYTFARLIEKHKDNKKVFLITCVIINTSIWFFPKSYNWIGLTFNRILSKISLPIQLPIFEFLIPIGISYFILQSIAYVIDVYKGKTTSEKNFFKFFLFISYFPAIVQGPISRYNQLSKTLFNENKFNYYNFCSNLLLIIFGLTKKMVVADRIAIFANYCFNNCTDLSGVILYLGAVAFSIQLYMDFSGCVDLCRGVSGLFGVHLINNFNRPYFSQSIKEFWGRWHISLSSWLKDYVYIPLGGNRKGALRKYANLTVTFLVSGLWHGAGFNFIVWGTLHSLYQISGDFYRQKGIQDKVYSMLKIEKNSISQKIFSTFITFNLVTFAWIIFNSKSLSLAMQYIINMFSGLDGHILFDGTLYNFGIDLIGYIILFLNIAFIFIIEFNQNKKQIGFRENILSMHIVLRWIICIVLIYNVIICGAYGSGFSETSFLYGGF